MGVRSAIIVFFFYVFIALCGTVWRIFTVRQVLPHPYGLPKQQLRKIVRLLEPQDYDYGRFPANFNG